MDNLPVLSGDHDDFLSRAISSNLPVESLERIVALYERAKAEHARQMFNIAFAGFQQEMGVIKRVKHGPMVNDNKAMYDYAPLEELVQATSELRAKYGLSYTFESQTVGSLDDGYVETWCIIHHIDGYDYYPKHPVRVPIREDIVSGRGNSALSGPQRVAWSITFSKRYAFANAFGLVTQDEDTDTPQARARRTPANDDAIKRIIALLPNTKFDTDYVCKVCKVTKIQDMTQQQAENIIKQLERLVNKEKIGDI